MNEHDQLSPQVQQVLSRIPKWYERWGTSLVGVIFVGVLIMSWFIRYPDAISAETVITTYRPPLTLHSRSEGILTRLKNEGASIDAGEELAMIVNATDFEEILSVEKQLDTVGILLEMPVVLADFRPAEYTHLGELQGDFASFTQHLKTYQYLLKTTYFKRRIENIKQRTLVLNNLNSKLLRQQKVLEDELEVYYRRFRRDSVLAATRALSSSDLEKTQIDYLQKKSELENILISMDQNNLLKAELGETQISGDQQYADTQQNASVLLRESMQKLQGHIDSWKQAYVISAPIKGTLSYLKNWSPGQFVNNNEAVFSVVPLTGQLVGQAQLPLQGSGKVRTGQRVLIKLDNYPSYQYGSLSGVVSTISLVPNADKYLVTISLPSGLKTNFNKTIGFKQQMRGTAQIITEEFSLFERIFFQLRSLFIERT